MSKIYFVTNQSPAIYRSVRIDRVLARSFRIFLIRLFIWFSVLSGLGSFVLVGVRSFNFSGFLFGFVPSLDPQTYLPSGVTLLGAFLICLGLLFLLLFFEFFYIANLRPSAALNKDGEVFLLDYDAAAAFWHTSMLSGGQIPGKMFWARIIKSGIIGPVLNRVGIAEEDFNNYIKSIADYTLSKDDLMLAMISIAILRKENVLGIAEFVEAAFAVDKSFERFAFDRKIKREILTGAALWMSRIARFIQSRKFYWESSYLARIPGIGKDLGFGYTFELDRHSRDLTGRGAAAFLGPRRKTIEEMENLLSRSAHANVLLVADEGEGRHTILEGLAAMIYEGRAHPAIEHKRMALVDFASMTAQTKTKGNFEELVKKIMSESVRAGNIILVLEDLPQALESAGAIGADLLGLLESYIAGPKTQVIALSNRKNYHDRIEKIGKLTELFASVQPEKLTADTAVIILEEAAMEFEMRHKVLFTYQALRQIYESADRYIVEGVMPEKAVQLLDEAGVAFESGGTKIVLAEDVENYITSKTGVPASAVGEKERKILLNLEDLLHERVIGQNEAIEQISEALRRARSGLGVSDRPIGSFLFLGPTGVGKTETAKALASVYFGGEDAMLRFDMSEFQGGDGIVKLIGGASGQDGVLSRKIHEHPFSLALFDEIEKASTDVLNLFLQILEEGFFSDARGTRISMRQTMIIVTSNAASGMILDLVRGGDDPSKNRSVVLDAVRKEGKFSPELLNRFDALVIFRPLSRQDLIKVAKLMLEELAGKLKKQDVELEITDALVDRITKLGYDPMFGARPMRRIIADRVEGVIAKKIIAGKLARGSSIRFSDEEVAKI